MIGRALDLAFKTEQFGALDLIAQDLNENSDPLVLERSAEFFSANQQDKMAVKLLAYAKKVFLHEIKCLDNVWRLLCFFGIICSTKWL
jgi:intraflagellar transport protein 140